MEHDLLEILSKYDIAGKYTIGLGTLHSINADGKGPEKHCTIYKKISHFNKVPVVEIKSWEQEKSCKVNVDYSHVPDHTAIMMYNYLKMMQWPANNIELKDK